MPKSPVLHFPDDLPNFVMAIHGDAEERDDALDELGVITGNEFTISC